MSPAQTPKVEEKNVLIKIPSISTSSGKKKDEEINDELEEKLNDVSSADKCTETPNRSENREEKGDDLKILRASLNINSPNSNGKQMVFP